MTTKPLSEQDVLSKIGRQELFTNYRKIQNGVIDNSDSHSINHSAHTSKRGGSFFRNDHSSSALHHDSSKSKGKKPIQEKSDEEGNLSVYD